MKRHPALHNLSEHHHHVLVLALEIRRAAQAPEPDRGQRLQELAQALLRFWQQSGQTHFQEEEQVLLPECARHFRIEQDPEIMRMLADHAAIRARIADLKQQLGSQSVSGLVLELGPMLHDHVRLEEDRIFPRLEAVLDQAELESVGSRLTRLHPSNRSATGGGTLP